MKIVCQNNLSDCDLFALYKNHSIKIDEFVKDHFYYIFLDSSSQIPLVYKSNQRVNLFPYWRKSKKFLESKNIISYDPNLPFLNLPGEIKLSVNFDKITSVSLDTTYYKNNRLNISSDNYKEIFNYVYNMNPSLGPIYAFSFLETLLEERPLSFNIIKEINRVNHHLKYLEKLLKLK